MPRITISDDVYDLLRDEKRTPEQVSALAEKLITAHPLPYHPEERTLVVEQSALLVLDSILGRGNVTSVADLVDKVQGLADLDVGKVKIPLTAPQLQALKERGMRQGKSAKQVLEGIVARFLTDYEAIPV
jgi:hypothetical protein